MERVEKKVVIDAYRGGEDTGSNNNGIIEKNYNLELSQYINNRLKELNIKSTLTRNSDETLNMENRVARIQNSYGKGNDVIVISNALTSTGENAEIIYALRNSNTLAKTLENELTKAGLNVEKYYQRRLPADTAKDYNTLIKDTANNESIIIYYGNINNQEEATFLKNNLENIGEAVVIALANYLNVPYQSTNDIYYTVKKGDSLYSIAQKYNTTVDELKKLNNLTTNNLAIGDVLKVKEKPKENNSSSEITYTVKKGDSLYQISKKYNISVEELKTYNNLKSNLLSIGDVLKIPTSNSSKNETTYTVKSGDSLYSIAKKFNTTVSELKQKNNLTSNLLQINQVLKIPTSNNSQSEVTYTVKSGDSLYSIAKKFNTTVSELKQKNNLTSNLLQINQVLKIPK